MNASLQTLDLRLPLGSIEAYLSYVNQLPLLSAEEEQALAIRLQKQNDLQAAKALIMSHLRYVAKVAKGYSGYGLPLNDLIQEGNIGLMKAIKRFDPNVGVRLVTFAVHWIKAEIHEFILRNWRIVKVATTKAQRKLFFNLRSMKKRLGWFSDTEINEVAEDLGVDPSEVREMEMRMNAIDAAYDSHDEAEEETNALLPAQFLANAEDNPAHTFESSDFESQSNELLYTALQSLDERSQAILKARWLNEEKETLQTLADRYQVSPERIRQLEKNAMDKLKVALSTALS